MQNSINPAPRHRGLFYASAYYLIYYAAQAAVVPFLTIYYQQQGLSGSQIGLLAGLSPIISMLCAPLWTGIADASGRHRLVLSISLLGVTGSVVLLSQVNGLAGLAIAVTSLAFFSSTIIPLSDSATLNMLGGERGRYGKIRLWGSIGWGLASPLAGKLIDSFGLKTGFLYAAMVYLVVLLVSLGMDHSHAHLRTPFWRGVRQLLADRRWYSFLGIAVVGGMSLSVLSNFLFIFMNSLGASKTLMGLVMLVATISEIPVLFFIDRLLRRFGARCLMAVSIVAYALRGFLVSLVKVPELLLFVQLLHGFTFALLVGSAVTLADEMAPQGLSATGQGLFSATMGGVGVATGAVLGGWIYEQVGGAGTFQIMSAIAIAALLVWLTIGKGLKDS